MQYLKMFGYDPGGLTIILGFGAILKVEPLHWKSSTSEPKWGLPMNSWKLEMSFKSVRWSDEIKLDLFEHMDVAHAGEALNFG